MSDCAVPIWGVWWFTLAICIGLGMATSIMLLIAVVAGAVPAWSASHCLPSAVELLQKGLKGTVGQGKESRKKSILTEKKSQKKMSRERDTKDKMFQDLSSEPDAKRTKGSRASELSRGAAESKNVPGGEASTEKFPTEGDVKGIRWQESWKNSSGFVPIGFPLSIPLAHLLEISANWLALALLV